VTVHTRCARAALGIGVGQDVLTADLVVQGVETIVAVERERVTLGRADYPPILGPVAAITVCELPSANVPPPLTVPSALGEALTVIVCYLGLTVSVARRVVLP
jgi:hypothetical protein